MTRRDYDLVLYGASGYTGRLVAQAILERYGVDAGFVWAIAGRDGDRLRATRDLIGAPTLQILAASSDRPDDLRRMAGSTRAVISTVGPYQQHGSTLVALCAELGTDYLDLCGEPVWMREMIDAHSEAARRSGARIVFSCGFDSIPFELGVFALQTSARESGLAPLTHVKSRLKSVKGNFSGGTLASLRASHAAAGGDTRAGRLMNDPFALTPGYVGAPQPDIKGEAFDDDLGEWVAPFVMEPINSKNVHRSNLLMGFPYGRNFIYDERACAGPGASGEAAARKMVKKAFDVLESDDGPKQGEGPSAEQRAAGSYSILFVGRNDAGDSMHYMVSGERDAGYGSTSRMLCETAGCLLDAATPLVMGGIWTPGAALGMRLVGRLSRHAGLTFGKVGSETRNG